MKRIQQLEQPHEHRKDEAERVFDKPIFTQILTGPSELWEGQHAHFEARVVPVGDPTLRFEWYVNGVELKLGKYYFPNPALFIKRVYFIKISFRLSFPRNP